MVCARFVDSVMAFMFRARIKLVEDSTMASVPKDMVSR